MLINFTQGSILYFDPFYFSNGDTPKRKYCLVLKELDNTLVLASLPTSKDSIPSHIVKHHGCIDLAEINFNCYLFLANRPVCDNGFAFPRNTHVYGFRIKEFPLREFDRLVSEGRTTISHLGCLLDAEYEALTDCLRRSSSVKRKYRNML
jgi:hypothetical protein